MSRGSSSHSPGLYAVNAYIIFTVFWVVAATAAVYPVPKLFVQFLCSNCLLLAALRLHFPWVGRLHDCRHAALAFSALTFTGPSVLIIVIVLH